MASIEPIIFLTILVFVVVWPALPKAQSYFLKKIYQRFAPGVIFMGLSHSWHMFCYADYSYSRRFEIHFLNASGDLLHAFQPNTYEWKKWFAEISFIDPLPDVILENCLLFFLRQGFPDAAKIEIMTFVGKRPEIPSSWNGSFGEQVNFPPYLLAGLYKNPQLGWDFRRPPKI